MSSKRAGLPAEVLTKAGASRGPPRVDKFRESRWGIGLRPGVLPIGRTRSASLNPHPHGTPCLPGVPGRNRTYNLVVRSHTLYPIELRGPRKTGRYVIYVFSKDRSLLSPVSSRSYGARTRTRILALTPSRRGGTTGAYEFKRSTLIQRYARNPAGTPRQRRGSACSGPGAAGLFYILILLLPFQRLGVQHINLGDVFADFPAVIQPFQILIHGDHAVIGRSLNYGFDLRHLVLANKVGNSWAVD